MGALKNNLLVSVLRGDIERFLNTNTELMFNERDLQVRVATWLRDSGHYDKVDMEYAVPKEELEARGLELKTLSFPWNNDLSIDVVVERLGEFAAVELKYATRPRGCEDRPLRRTVENPLPHREEPGRQRLNHV